MFLFQRAEFGVLEEQEFLAMGVETDPGLHLGGLAAQFEDGSGAKTIVFYPLIHR